MFCAVDSHGELRQGEVGREARPGPLRDVEGKSIFCVPSRGRSGGPGKFVSQPPSDGMGSAQCRGEFPNIVGINFFF